MAGFADLALVFFSRPGGGGSGHQGLIDRGDGDHLTFGGRTGRS